MTTPPTIAPIGCFCEIMEVGACLTCTCPDCGEFGRFGATIQHTCSPIN